MVTGEVVETARIETADRTLEPSLQVQPVRVGHDGEEFERELTEVLGLPV